MGRFGGGETQRKVGQGTKVFSLSTAVLVAVLTLWMYVFIYKKFQ